MPDKSNRSKLYSEIYTEKFLNLILDLILNKTIVNLIERPIALSVFQSPL